MNLDNISAVQTSAGKGTRLRPLNLYSATSMIPKGLIRLLGTPIAEDQLEKFKRSGLSQVYMITQYLENRHLLLERFGNGSRFGIKIDYSYPKDDDDNNGSGDAILRNIEKKNIHGHSVILANDNLYEYDLEEAVSDHLKKKAVITIMTVRVKPVSAIRTYGLLDTDADKRVRKIAEKPDTVDELKAFMGIEDDEGLESETVKINTAGYIVDNDELLRLAQREDWINKGRSKATSKGFDMAGDLIKGLVERGHGVYTTPIDRWGDFGTIGYFLQTFPKALSGQFPSLVDVLLAKGYNRLPGVENVWVWGETLHREYNGMTLDERIRSGAVKLGPNVFIGRDVLISDGARIKYSDVEEQSMVGEGAELDHAYVSTFSEIGPGAVVRKSALGLAAQINSTLEARTVLEAGSVIGPKIEVPPGTRLITTKVFPSYTFDQEPSQLFERKTLTPDMDDIQGAIQDYQKDR